MAGCVGEFWTELCARHLPSFANLPTDEMHALGRAYGMGLQRPYLKPEPSAGMIIAVDPPWYLDLGEGETEFLHLEYANGDKL